ncbi:hypothetical protein [Bacillus sp. MRMR6]|uniref:hypothetical protein n=1 Tax=Bacillus sp. MRMR6 TaxID=1928617 RepID=UPI000951A397|nr:hypothetical protein [Bacillus sp. MRMR6]OLS33961.1 hypothetical protein BTR25_23460 [Bacillus sp. MRMR6]
MSKAVVFEKGPFSKVHSVLTSQGFQLISNDHSLKYSVKLKDSSTQSIYQLEIPVNPIKEGSTQAKLGSPNLYGDKRIPEPVREAAESKLYEIADYIKSKLVIKNRSADQAEEKNTMVRNEADMKELGKVMESMQTQAELERDGMLTDPEQYESKV